MVGSRFMAMTSTHETYHRRHSAGGRVWPRRAWGVACSGGGSDARQTAKEARLLQVAVQVVHLFPVDD